MSSESEHQVAEIDAGETSLDPQETACKRSNDPLPSDPATPPADDRMHDEHPEASFRHGFWRNSRRLVLAALDALGVPSARIARFCDCGANAWVVRDRATHQRYALRCNRCRDRFCCACSGEKRRTVCRNLKTFAHGQHLRFLTLTLRANDQGLSQRLSTLRSSWLRFRRTRAISRLMTGGVCFLEIQYNHERGTWHPHLHVLCAGKYLPHQLVSQTWHAITGDSYIVSIRDVKNPDVAVSYVAKYAGKPLPDTIFRRAPLLQEAMLALFGTKQFATFGTWTHAKLTSISDTDTEWEALGTLEDVIFRAKHGDAEARNALKALRFTVIYDSDDDNNTDTS